MEDNNIKTDIINKEEDRKQQQKQEQEQIQEKKIKGGKFDNRDIYLMMSIIFILLMIFMIFMYISHIDNRKPCPNLYIDKSNIHGVGVYNKIPYNKNDRIFLAIDNNNKITYTGSKINHSNNANTRLLETSDGWNIVALDKLKKNIELTVNYNHTPNFIKKADPSWK